MKSKRIALISLILLILLTSLGTISASDIKEINAGEDLAIDTTIRGMDEPIVNDERFNQDIPKENVKNDTNDITEDLNENDRDTDKINSNSKSFSKLEASNLQSTITIDGSANNQMVNPTIQNAINNAKAGDTIIITGKSYVHCHFVVDKPLTIISNVGTTMSPCPSNTKGSGTYGLFYISPEASGTVIQGFTLSNTIDEYDAYGILIRGASDVKIINCNINTTKYGDGIRLERASNTIINNSVVKNSNIGIHIVNSTKTTITNNNITNNSITGIYIGENDMDTTIHTNNITYNRNTGINMTSADNVYIINNYIAFNRNGDDHNTTSGAGVYVNCNLTKVEIKGNFIRQNGLYGVLNDYRTRNMDAKKYAELLEVNTNNYYIGHKERVAYHIEYKKYNKGPFTYDAEKDIYVFVGEGNGDYDVDKTVVYLGYAFYTDETICGSTLYSAPSTTWGSGNYKLSISEITQNKKGTYSVSIVDKDGNIAKELSSIYVTFYLNKDNNKAEPQSGDIYRTVLMQNGTATADFTNETFKESGNVIIAAFPGLYPTYTTNPYAKLNVPDEDIPGTYRQTKITVSNMNLVPKSGEYFIATLKDENENPVAGEKLSLKISGVKTYSVVTDSKGQAKLQINLASQGTYAVTVSYAGNENYNKSSAKASISIKKQTPKIASSNMNFIPNSGEYFTATFTDANGKAIANKKAIFTIGKTTYTKTTDNNGNTKLQINLAYTGQYKILIKSPTTDQYYAANKTNTITIKAGAKKVKIEASNASYVPKSGKYYNICLKDESNNPIANKKVSLTIGKTTYTKTTDNNGNAKLQINLAYAGKYNITLRFSGDDIYSPSTKKVVLTIKKANPNLISFNRTFMNKSGLKYTVTLKDYEGKAISNQKIIFEIKNGKKSNNYTKTTNSEGIAELGINMAYLQTYKIISKYGGDSQNNALSKTNYLRIVNGTNTSFIDPNLPNSEVQRIIDTTPEGFDIKFLGEEYFDIALKINKSSNIFSDVNTILNGKSGNTVININSENINISNLIINANSTVNEANGIIINNSKNVKLDKNIVKNVLDSNKIEDYNNGSEILPGMGIGIFNSAQVNIVNNTVNSFESGIYAESSQEFKLCENELSLSNYGIKYGFGNSNTEIKNNAVKDNIGWYTEEVPEGPRGYGIFLNNSATNITINQNNISNNYIGISIDANNSTGIIITSNLIADNSLEGIRFNAPYDLAENAVEPYVTDNAIYRNAEGPSMMILGEMSANPEGIYGAGQWDEELRLKIDANWYGANSLRTWDYDSGIVGVGTMCPRIKTTTIKFTTITSTSPGTYSIDFYKNEKLATNLATFDIYATLNRNSDKKTEVHFYVINGTGTFSFDKANYLDTDNTIEISVGSLINVVDRIYSVIYSYNVPKSEIPA